MIERSVSANLAEAASTLGTLRGIERVTAELETLSAHLIGSDAAADREELGCLLRDLRALAGTIATVGRVVADRIDWSRRHG